MSRAESPDANVAGECLYHGTPRRSNVQRIMHEGFRGFPGGFGTGIYLSRNWRVTIPYGAWLLGVELAPGTRILDTSAQPSQKTLNSLRREFGQALLASSSPLKALPRNKQLTGPELRALISHHHARIVRSNMRRCAWNPGLIQTLRRLAQSHGYDAIGHPSSAWGLVVFEPVRLKLRELVFAPLEDKRGQGIGYFGIDSAPDLPTARRRFARDGRARDRRLAEEIESRAKASRS